MLYFVCNNMNVKFYHSHLHPYFVEKGDSLRVIGHQSVKYFKPLCMEHTFVTDNDSIMFPEVKLYCLGL